MSKFLRQLLVFTICFVLVNSVYLEIVKRVDWNFSKRIEALELANPDFELVVIGNSLPMDGIDTGFLDQHGIDAYNLSIGGASFKTSHIQLQQYLEICDKKPELVILGSSSYIGDFDSDRVLGIVEFTSKNGKRDFWNVPLLRFKGMFIEMVKKIVSPPHRNAVLVKGQLRFSRTTIDKTDLNLDEEFTFDAYHESSELAAISATCERHDIQLVVVEMPGFMYTRHRGTPEIMKLNSTGAILVDCNNVVFCTIFDPETDWIGNNHLNTFGARKFTQALISIIQDLGQTD